MKILFLPVLTACVFLFSCHSSKKLINKVIAPKDSVIVVPGNVSKDSLLLVETTTNNLQANYINFKSFSAKIKVEIEDAKGKQPDLTATLRMIKDSAIWLSLTGSFLGVEVYRVHITPDSVILMNKLDKEVQYRSLDYLQDVTQIPFDFRSIQDMFIGNPVFFNPADVIFKKRDELVLASSIGDQFKNLLTLAAGSNLVLHTKLDDVDVYRNRTASVSYDDYQNIEGKNFSTRRQITISEKNKLDIRLNFKQIEFNKELSVGFVVPKNYKKK